MTLPCFEIDVYWTRLRLASALLLAIFFSLFIIVIFLFTKTEWGFETNPVMNEKARRVLDGTKDLISLPTVYQICEQLEKRKHVSGEH